MTSWATQYSFGGPNWAGEPPIVTLDQFNSSINLTYSSIGFTSTVSNVLSTTTGIVSNGLQTQINSLTLSTGGTTNQWSLFSSITNVNMAGFDLYNARFVSTLDLQCSSINGADIAINNSTVTIQGVTITNNTVTTKEVQSSNSRTSNSAIDNFVGGVNAVATSVTNINQAVGGFLSNNFGVLQQAYYGTAIAGQVVNLANGTVALATGIQGMVDARQVGTLSGDTNINAVFETINHTAQLQFSTLNSTTLTYLRTTDQANPNASFGREIIISSYISAGTKCLRSIGDPLNVPIASTQLLSTTNFVQAFGQWVPILANDNNLNANTASISSLQVSSIYNNYFSTARAFMSSINGQPISAFINTGDVTFTSISTNTLSTGSALLSSINGINITTILNPTILPSLSTTSISTAQIIVSSIYANYLSTANISVSSITANSLSTATASVSSLTTNALSTATATISSINGINIYDLLNKTPSNLSAATVSTSFLQVSTAQITTAYISSLFASTVTTCNLVNDFYSTTTGFFDVINVSSLFGGNLAGDFLDVSGARISFKNCNSDSTDPAGVQIYTSNDNYYVQAGIPSATEFSSYTAMTSWENQASNFITNPSYFPSLPGGSVNITLNGGNYFIGTVSTESSGRNFYTNNSGFYQLVTIRAGQLYVNLPNGSYSFWTSNSAGFVVFFQDIRGNQQGDPAYIETNEYVTVNYFNIGSSNFSYTITNNIPLIAYSSTNTTSITNLVMDNFDTVITTSNTYTASGIKYGFAGNLALNYSTIAFGPSTVRGATVPYTFSGTVQSPQVSSMNMQVSSINGYAFSDIVNPGYTYSTFSNVYLTPANGFGLNMSTGSIGTSFDTISSVSANILTATMSFTTTDQAFIPFTPPQMNIGPSNINIWASTIIRVTQPQVGTTSNSISLDILGGGRTGQVDVCNTSGCNAFIKGGILGFLPNNSWRRFTYTGSFWTQNFSPTPQNATYDTTLNIYQKYDGAYITTGDYLYMSTGGVQVDGDFYADNVYPANLQVTGSAQFNSISTNTIDATTITAGNIYAPITSATINVSNINYSTISGRPGEGQTGISQLLYYGSIGTRLNYTDPNTNHFNSFPWVSSLNTTTVAQGQISYPTYPGGNFALVPKHSGSNTYYLNGNGTVTTPSNNPQDTWVSSMMTCWFNTYPTPSDLIRNPGTRGEVILIGTNTASSAYFFQFNGTSAVQAFMTLGSIHKWTCTDGTNWTCNTSASLYPTTTYTDTMSLVQKPGGVLSLNAQYIAFSDLTVVTYNQRKDGTLTLEGAYGKAQIDNIPVEYNGKRFKVNDYVCTVAFTQYGARQVSLATNEVAVNCQDDGSGFWKMQIRLTTATIPGVERGCYWNYQVTLTPRPLATGTHSQANFDELPSTGYAFYPEIGISSIFASTLTLSASENISLLAGLSTPTYISSGSITIGGTNTVAVLGNIVAVGGFTDVNIEGLTGDVNVSAASTINLAAGNLVDINDISFTTNAPNSWTTGSVHTLFGDVPAGGKYLQWSYNNNPGTLITDNHSINISTNNINLYGAIGAVGTLYMNNNNIEQVKNIYFQNGDFIDATTISGQRFFSIYGGGSNHYVTINNGNGAVQIAGDNNVYLVGGGGAIGGVNAVNIQGSGLYFNGTSPVYMNSNNIDTGGGRIYGSNTGSLGQYIPFRSFYNPPTGSGQSSEIQVSGKAQDAGAITTVKMGVDIPAGLAYINSEWDGYITMPLALNGSQVAVNCPLYLLLGSNSIQQPIQQYGTTTGSSASGSVTVTLPHAYTSGTSYVAFGVMQDSDEAKIAVNRNNLSSITIVWSQGGSGSHAIAWNTMGT